MINLSNSSSAVFIYSLRDNIPIPKSPSMLQQQLGQLISTMYPNYDVSSTLTNLVLLTSYLYDCMPLSLMRSIASSIRSTTVVI